MSKIVAKLNLNKIPQNVENNSLMMAKNVRLLEDGSIGPDTSLENVETNTGDFITYTVHHDAVTEQVTVFEYTILNPTRSVAHAGGTTYNDTQLENYAFDFVNYHPNDVEYESSNNRSFIKKFYKVSYKSACSIWVYRIDSTYNLYWNGERFTYDYNNKQLKNKAGELLLVAVWDSTLNDGYTQPPVGSNLVEYYYIVAPTSVLSDGYIRIKNCYYKVVNPVYHTTSSATHTVESAYDETVTEYNVVEYISQIVGFDNKIYFIKESDYIKYSSTARTKILAKYTTETFIDVASPGNKRKSFSVNTDGYVLRDGELFRDKGIAIELIPNFNDRVKIIEYDEISNIFKVVLCGWKYNGGKVTGCVFRNNTGNTILTICEYDVTVTSIPLKNINLSSCKENDDESIYYQNPNIPITNLLLNGEYKVNIPAGVYQFFIRYKIAEDWYTGWFPCSKECYAGAKKRIATTIGELKYIDKHSDSDNSFIFSVQHLYPEYNQIYSKFQIGFILSKDDNAIVAREWKEFNFNTNSIYFTCLESEIKEANIDDFLETNYELFNVKHCVNFKNKLYIADYKETDFNPDLQSYASNINITIKTFNIGASQTGSFFDNELLISTAQSNDCDYTIESTPNNHIRNKWAKPPYFELIDSIEANDTSGYSSFNNKKFPYVGTEHHHIENSNIQMFDCNACHPNNGIGVDDDTIVDGLPDTSWSNSRNDFLLDQACVLSIYIKSQSNNSYVQLYADYRAKYNNAYQQGQGSLFNPTVDYIECLTGNTHNDVFNYCDNTIRSTISKFNKSNYRWFTKKGSTHYPFNEYYVVYTVVRESKPRVHIKLPQQTIDHGDSDLVDLWPKYYHNKNEVTTSESAWRNAFEPEFDIVYTKKTTYILKRTLNFDSSYITTTISNYLTPPTLLPFTNYNFYVHYVKANGITTNGYLLNRYPVYIGKYATDDGSTSTRGNIYYYDYGTIINNVADDNIIIYPSFDNITCPPGYVGCFISVAKVGNDVCQLFNVHCKSSENECTFQADCLELDTLLYTKYDNITVYNSDGDVVTRSAKYYSSGNTEIMSTFGECGSILWTETTNTNANKDVFWLVIPYTTTAKRLIKYTPYITLSSDPTSYDNYNDVTNIGFTCFVKKLKKQYIDYTGSDKFPYITGSDIYKITLNDYSSGGDSGTLVLEDLTLASDANYYYLQKNNPEPRIKSNFNLNYLNLSEDLTPIPKTYTYQSEETQYSHRYLTCLINSLTSSHLYEFNSWYKDFTRKEYSICDERKITIFKNTLRCSNIIGDEEISTFRFAATDYYNVPTQRGIITNLVSIANSLYVHCEHSLFKFTDNKTLNSQEEDVVLQENDIFNSGITEVFDAKYGYAGLKDREQSLVTFNAYIFYDEVARKIFAFEGNNQIASIDEPIKKLINVVNPTNVIFAADELHNRFFVNLINNEGNVCLSFSFISKAFVSIHDFNFKLAFHTRRNTYFIHENRYNGIKTGWSIYKMVEYVMTIKQRTDQQETQPDIYDSIYYVYNYSAYQNCYERSLVKIPDCDTITLNDVHSAIGIVDVIVNTQYEKVKVLNYVNWICSEIGRYGINDNNVAEERLNRLYPGTRLRIYSDATETSLISLVNSNGSPKIANEYRNIDEYGNPAPSKESWQYPQYNCGIWSMNYFRDVKNIEDAFNYKDAANQITGGTGHSQTTDLTPKITRQNLTQENSLLYGKYFVVRFIFNNKNFKLENVILRMNDYEKVK